MRIPIVILCLVACLVFAGWRGSQDQHGPALESEIGLESEVGERDLPVELKASTPLLQAEEALSATREAAVPAADGIVLRLPDGWPLDVFAKLVFLVDGRVMKRKITAAGAVTLAPAGWEAVGLALPQAEPFCFRPEDLPRDAKGHSLIDLHDLKVDFAIEDHHAYQNRLEGKKPKFDFRVTHAEAFNFPSDLQKAIRMGSKRKIRMEGSGGFSLLLSQTPGFVSIGIHSPFQISDGESPVGRFEDFSLQSRRHTVHVWNPMGIKVRIEEHGAWVGNRKPSKYQVVAKSKDLSGEDLRMTIVHATAGEQFIMAVPLAAEHVDVECYGLKEDWPVAVSSYPIVNSTHVYVLDVPLGDCRLRIVDAAGAPIENVRFVANDRLVGSSDENGAGVLAQSLVDESMVLLYRRGYTMRKFDKGSLQSAPQENLVTMSVANSLRVILEGGRSGEFHVQLPNEIFIKGSGEDYDWPCDFNSTQGTEYGMDYFGGDTTHVIFGPGKSTEDGDGAELVISGAFLKDAASESFPVQLLDELGNYAGQAEASLIPGQETIVRFSSNSCFSKYAGKVLDPSGNPLSGVGLVSQGTFSLVSKELTNSAGEFKLIASASAAKLALRKEGFVDQTCVVQGKLLKETFTMEASRDVTVSTLLEDGTPSSVRSVCVRLDAGIIFGWTCKPGHHLLVDLPKGEVTLEIGSGKNCYNVTLPADVTEWEVPR